MLLFLAACTNANTTPPEAAPPADSESANVTLVLWQSWSGTDGQVISRLVNEYNNQNPQGRVLVQAISMSTLDDEFRTQATRGSGPHMIMMPSSWVGELASADLFLPLDEFISPAERNMLLPVTLGSGQIRNTEGETTLYGLPISFDTLALFYNQANIETAPEDTDDLLRLARGLSDPDDEPPRWGWAMDLSINETIGYLHAFGGQVFDENGEVVLANAGSDGAEQWLEWLMALNDDPQLFVRLDSSIQVERHVKNNQVVMSFGWAHELAAYRQLWGGQMGIAPLPVLSETNQAPQPYVQSTLLAVNQGISETERNAAMAFLRYMISEEVQEVLLEHEIQPARQDLRLSGDEPHLIAARIFRAQAEQSQPILNGRERDLIWRELQLMQRQAVTKSINPADAVLNADQRLRDQLESDNP